MRSLRTWLLVALAMTLVGCIPMIISEEPLGEIVALEPGKWEGSWLDADGGVLFFQVLDAKNGVIDVGGTSCKPGRQEAIQLRKAPGQRFQGGGAVDWYFPLDVEMRTQGAFTYKWGPVGKCVADPPRCVYLITIVRSSDALIMYPIAEGGQIKSLVDTGALPGRAKKDEVVLGQLKTEHFDVLFANDRPVINWRDGKPLIKLPHELDPCKAKKPPK